MNTAADDDATVRRSERPTSASAPERIRIARIVGALPGPSQRLDAVLRRRLRALCLIVFFGVGSVASFQLWCMYRGIPAIPDAIEFVRLRNVKIFEAFVLVVYAALFVSLIRFPRMSLRGLRNIELLLIGTLAAYLLYMHYDWHAGAMPRLRHDDANKLSIYWLYRMSSNSAALPWMALMVGYATVIPNTGRRCAAVLAVLAPLPIIVALVSRFWLDSMDRNTFIAYLFDLTMWNSISAAIGIAGAYRIENLRCQAESARQLGQYIIKDRIGGGGMGEVFLADHVLLRRPCAVKVIRPEMMGDPGALERFEREVQTTATLSHPNTIQIYDYGRADDGTFYYAMEYLPGKSLDRIIREQGPMDFLLLVRVMKQLCGALAEAHGIGLIHRDIKPQNVILCNRGGVENVAKLLDFGLVKKQSLHEKDTSLTVQGTIAGTPSYMSPEQAGGESDIDARSDIYSLGALAYYLITGQPPFVRPTPVQTMAAHLADPVSPPANYNNDVPPGLEAIVMRALNKKREDRFQSVSEMTQALDSLSHPAQGGIA